MKVAVKYFILTTVILATAAYFASGLLAIVFLLAIPVSAIFLLFSLGQGSTGAERTGIYPGVMTASVVILFVTGKFYSLRMTFTMPAAFTRYLGSEGFDGSKTIERNGDRLPPLKGDKAVAIHTNFRATSNKAMWIASKIYD